MLLISPIAVFSANDEVSWHNKSPIEEVHVYLNMHFEKALVCKNVDSSGGNQYFDNEYCEVTSTSTTYGIGGFVTSGGVTNINNITSGGAYSNYTTQIVSQFIGGSPVSFTITSASGTAGMGVWIDWNNDLDFNDAGEQIYLSGMYVNPGNGTINIPAGTPLGNYRMRVVSNWLTASPSPCGNLGNAAYGEAEDYTFAVIEVPACMPPSQLNIVGVTASTAEVEWSSPADQDTWHILVLPEGSDAPTETTTGFEEVDENPYTIEGLDPTTNYDLYVRADCGTDGASLWSKMSFTTGCTTFNIPFWEGFNSDSSTEQCWTVLNENNDADQWDMNYTSTPYEGNQAAVLNTDFNNGNNDDWLISPNIDLTNTLGAARLKFHYKVQSSSEPNDFRVMLSTTGSNPADFTTELLPVTQVNNTTYQEMIINLVDDAGVALQQEVFVAFHVPQGGLDGWRLYIDNVIIEPYNADCPDPTDVVINQTTENSIEIGWTAPEDQDSWNVYVVPAGDPAPDDTTTDYEEVTENPYTIQGLDPATSYDVYVRSDCNTDGFSYWVGPIAATTTQVPSPVNFIDDFEEDSGWTFTNEGQTNQWHVGNATFYEGDSSLYISNDQGDSNAYTLSSSTTTHAIKDLSFPATTNEVTINFWWKGRGEGTSFDYMRVWLMPSTYQPVAGTQIVAANGGIQLGGNFNNQEEWEEYFQLLNLSDYAGQVGRLVFEWRNDGSGGTQPPAAVDNVEVKLVTCSRPIDVVVEKHQVTNALVASWTPVSGETQWEVIVQDAADPAPDENTVGIIVNTPQYTIPNVVNGQFYKIYVRAICSEDDSSLWTDGVDFSDFNPPACAKIDMEFPDLNMDVNGDFVHCAGELTLNLEAAFDDSMFKATDSYTVEQIEFLPPFPTTGGIEMNVFVDDVFSPNIELPFDFCFYGNNFSTAQVSSNGVIHLGGGYTGSSPWSMDGFGNGNVTSFPSPNYLLAEPEFKNVIMGVYQDIDPVPSKSPNANINYQVLGTYPCRALVVNFSEIRLYGCVNQQPAQNYQIVLYEITNIIEVYVFNRESCGPDGHNSGKGAIGLINNDGTQATIPPDRNVGTWTATNEAWRFSPNGDTNVEFGWYMNGNLISNNPSHQITIDGANETFDFEARVSYPGCVGGEDLVLKKGFTVKISEELDLGTPADLIFCSNNMQDEDRPRITDNYETIMQNITEKDAFNVTYHLTDEDAQAGTSPIGDPYNYIPEDCPKTIFVRVESIETLCFETTTFVVNCGITPELRLEDVMICNVYQLPTLPSNQEYLYYEYTSYASGSVEVVENPTTTQTLEPGRYEVFVQATSVDGCYEIDSYFIDIFPCIIPKGISPNGDGDNDYLDLSNYMVQEITIYNRYGKQVYSRGSDYKREWVGQDNNGKALPTGTYYYNIITPFQRFTGYIYLTKEVK